MLTNFHTHTIFCDGKNTPEEVVLAALEKGFSALGFSGHGYTAYDHNYCMQDTEGYIAEINRLKDKYKNDIQIYLGTEEDSHSLVDRDRYDYLIGSCHYLHMGDQYLPVDYSLDHYKRNLEWFGGDALTMAETYYRAFCEYILSRKPDIIGHFDIITKYDELETSYLLNDPAYNRLAETYITKAAESGGIFEVNTHAVDRGYRTHVYPNENLLYTLKKLNAPIILSADSHRIETLDFGFEETKKHLRDIGFTKAYTLFNNEFVSYDL